MKKQRKKYGVIISLLVIAAVLSGVCIFHVKKEAGKKWYEKSSTICHAFGRTEDGESLTNSLEAFEYNYKLGQRVFEVDLAVTSDNVLVMPYTWFGSSVYEELKDYPVQIYVHTVNEMQDAYRMLDCGASGIYTDCILTKDLQR